MIESPIPTLCTLTEPDPILPGSRAATFEVIGQNRQRFAVKLNGSTPPAGWDAARKNQLQLAELLLHYQFPDFSNVITIEPGTVKFIGEQDRVVQIPSSF